MYFIMQDDGFLQITFIQKYRCIYNDNLGFVFCHRLQRFLGNVGLAIESCRYRNSGSYRPYIRDPLC